jgi:hypothetical protein
MTNQRKPVILFVIFILNIAPIYVDIDMAVGSRLLLPTQQALYEQGKVDSRQA